jgi:hypothetical protein
LQLSLYTRFKEENPNVEVGLRIFESLKPWYVKRLQEFNSCCCRYHVQIAELKDGFNNMRRRFLHTSCNCNCDVCGARGPETPCWASSSTVEGVRAMCDLVLCSKLESMDFHKLDCIRGNCTDCGVWKLQLCPHEVDPNSTILIPWRKFENVFVGQNSEGGDRHALRLEYKTTPPSEFIAFLKPKLAKFVAHNFEAKWQDAQFKSCLENLSSDQVLSVIDFAENYSFTWQNEVQSQHWQSFQVTILVHITFRIDPHWDEVDVRAKILTEYHFYVSDDKIHDNLFVQYCFGLHWLFLRESGHALPVEHIVFSDGCSSQFKCARSLFFVTRYPTLTRSPQLPNGCAMQWNHFGSGHGKGRWDGAGATIKQALRAEQVKPDGIRLHNASDAVAYLRQYMGRQYAGYTNVRRDVKRYFYEVASTDVVRADQFNARRVEGTRSFHQVRSVGLDMISLQVRTLSCFCSFCQDGGDGPCDNAAYVEAYKLIRIEPCNIDDVRADVEHVDVIGEGDREAIVACLEVGDHFAVVADEGNSEDADFWILITEQTLHAVEEESREDCWGQKVYKGEQIVVGRYYKQQGRSMRSYVLCDAGPAYIYSHLVIAAKFAMVPARHRQKGGREGTQVHAIYTTPILYAHLEI